MAKEVFIPTNGECLKPKSIDGLLALLVLGAQLLKVSFQLLSKELLHILHLFDYLLDTFLIFTEDCLHVSFYCINCLLINIWYIKTRCLVLARHQHNTLVCCGEVFLLDLRWTPNVLIEFGHAVYVQIINVYLGSESLVEVRLQGLTLK